MLDPITITVLERKLDSIAREMGIVMRRAARSPIFSESHDFSCFLTDSKGRLISVAEGIPIHTGGGGFAVRSLLAYWGDDIGPGDVFLSNDPYVAGGNHLPDVTVMHPVFAEGRLIGFACNRAHQVDIGGGMPGTYNSNAIEIFDEGIRIPPIKIYERDKIRRDVWDMVALNTRSPRTVQGDLGAMVGSARIGARRLHAIFDEYGFENTLDHLEGLLNYAERRMRNELATIPDGRYVGSAEMNNDVFSRRSVKVVATITIAGSDITVDFTGTDTQIPAFKNSSLANTYAAVYMAVACVADPFIPKNEGMFRPITIVAPLGTVVNPEPPAPVTFATVFPAVQIISACWQALAKAVPERVSAGWGAPSFPTTAGYEKGEAWVVYHWGGSSGAGAIQGRDGFNQIGSLITLGGLTLPNMELYERVYPVRFKKWEFRTDGGGSGEFRGGTGVVYEIELLRPAKWGFRGEGFYDPTGFGLNGGSPGREAHGTLAASGQSERPAPQYAIEDLEPTTFHLESPGGGGWGNPLHRDPEAVRADVINEIVSAQAAREVYGVSLTSSLEVDLEGTAKCRHSLSSRLQA